MAPNRDKRVLLLYVLCRILRHPSERREYHGGRAETRCPCGEIQVSDRAIR